ncbi:hypothetical protein BDV29DRAFT_192349 [Aspergillus leporis]|uniref:Uncharacterized protein n=1 Tax=Aspergillus leporis TaxID=41062 RepID=A0A5N5WY88_9EURO|nr:hypothetical protein BDV29DRAFT_192349 [Aspergillus leporis]
MKQPMPLAVASEENRQRDRTRFQAVLSATPQPGCDPSEETLSPHPVLTDPEFIRRLKDFHEALVKAAVDITSVEQVLHWVDDRSRVKAMPPYRDCLSHWRPELLLTDNGGTKGLGFQLCEINSRAPFNAIQLLGADPTLQPAGNFNEMVDSLLSFFILEQPIFLVRGRDRLHRQDFIQLVERVSGLRPRLVQVEDLQLRPDPFSATGYSLYCDVQGAPPEKVHQVALSLFSDEFNLLSQDMLRQLATIAVNDFRTTLLVNDQRFLGIVLQEVDDLVNKHNILTPGESRHLQEEVTKKDYILKAARQSRGEGHLLGDKLTLAEWESILQSMQDASIEEGTTTYVLQPYVLQPTFDLIVHETRVERDSRMVGTYYTVNGRYLGLGPWRAGRARICNVHGGGCVGLYSVTRTEGEGSQNHERDI